MAFRITDCTAKFPGTITVSFSEPAQGADVADNYAITNVDTGSSIDLTDADVKLDPAQQVATITLAAGGVQLPQGRWIKVVVSAVTPAAGGTTIGNGGADTFFARVNGDGDPLGDIARSTQTIASQVTSAAGTVGDIASFPVLTEEIGYPPSPVATAGGASSMAPSGASLGQIATKAISDVLGWKLKTDDPKAFVGALTASFTCKDVEGHTDCTWVPRTYAIQTDLSGGITGAQASIYSRAKDALDQSLPLLDGLYPLFEEASPEDVAALRATVRSQMTDLVSELGLLGGPRISRVNQFFLLLLGQTLPSSPPPGTFTLTTDPDSIEGSLGNLRDEFGFSEEDDLVNTVEDEQNVTNYRIISDYLTSLAQTWINNLQFFGLSPTATPFFGTQLVLISRQLSVVAESVNEVRFTLDSVFIGPAERQTLQIDFATGDPSMFLEDLLSWIYGFASDEGPRLIQDGGKFAVGQSFVPIARQLQAFAFGAITPSNIGLLPPGYSSQRVQRSLQNLSDQLQDLLDLATPIKHVITPEPEPLLPLALSSVSPNVGRRGIPGTPTTLLVQMTGTGFEVEAKTEFTPKTGIDAKTFFSSQGRLVAKLTIEATASPGRRDVTVTNPDGQAFTLRGGFTVTA